MGITRRLTRLSATQAASSRHEMKSLTLVLCFCASATLAAPQGDCRTAKKIKYIEEFENQCHRESRQKCTWSTKYVEKCVTEPIRVCEKFWKNDGYGGKVWTEDLKKCHNLETDECMDEPEPIKECKPISENICEQVHKNKPHQFECEICGGKEKAGSCKRLDGGYSPVPDDVEVFVAIRD